MLGAPVLCGTWIADLGGTVLSGLLNPIFWLLYLGYGVIGEYLAPLCVALGMTVLVSTVKQMIADGRPLRAVAGLDVRVHLGAALRRLGDE
jgi:hypothetical protein